MQVLDTAVMQLNTNNNILVFYSVTYHWQSEQLVDFMEYVALSLPTGWSNS